MPKVSVLIKAVLLRCYYPWPLLSIRNRQGTYQHPAMLRKRVRNC
ncbi:hypothetical protein CY0110_16002 [Crocosphaera chwakensis CCY0110]|uniref:Uncharacterized protein n=1 Tax=Crocosphaera chwakensis CCY0110 TaxID=391612 RepID=A3IHN2_9CHRO|nr:hypothetical protein CY0110_16002 [Crocosphaera chwakensis CCY0110]